MGASQRSVVLNAFLPAQEVSEPSMFVGRGREVAELVDALRIHGSAPLIFGPRGLGKSSLAQQIQRIAQGDTELLDLLGLGGRAFDEAEMFLVVRVACSRTTGGVENLLSLMTGALESAARDLLASADEGAVERTSSTTLTVAFVKQQWASKTTDPQRVPIATQGVGEALAALCELVAERSGRRVLFIVDELDLLTDTTGLASFVKTYSSTWLKLMFVGIADSHLDLVSEHESVVRNLFPVLVPTMQDGELDAIISHAEASVAEAGVEIVFRGRARSKIIRLASGFPWFVHLLGQLALRQAFDAGRAEVTTSDVTDSVRRLLDERLAQEHADRYRQAVGESREREMVLRLAASMDKTDISIPIVEQMAASLGIDDPRRIVDQLHQLGFGAPLRATRPGAFSRFADEIFRIYARICPSVFPNVDSRVNEAFEGVDVGIKRRRGRHAG